MSRIPIAAPARLGYLTAATCVKGTAMNPEKLVIAKRCLAAAHDGSLAFPEIIRLLIDAGFEGYSVDYRGNSQTYYLTDGDCVTLDMPGGAGIVAPHFDAARIEGLVRWAQSDAADYSYAAFSDQAMAAGCAGYLVSFPGRRVVYFGRTAETHVEHFPD